MYGWEPVETTEYIYDGDRLVRTVTRRESEWSPDQVALLIASRRAEAELGPYGIPLSRATDPDAVFEASQLPTVNKAVLAAHKAQEAYFKQYEAARDQQDALMWSVHEVTDAGA